MKRLGVLVFCILLLASCNRTSPTAPQDPVFTSQSLSGLGIVKFEANSKGLFAFLVKVSGSSRDYSLRKYNLNGGIAWERAISTEIYDGTHPTPSVSFAVDSAGRSYVSSFGSSGSYIRKFSASGTLLWKKPFSYTDPAIPGVRLEFLGGLTVDSLGNLYGVQNIYFTSSYANYIHKLSPSGQLLRTSKFQLLNPPKRAMIDDIHIDGNGNLYALYADEVNLCCINGSFPNGNNLRMLKYNATGTLLWDHIVFTDTWGDVTRFQNGKFVFDSQGNVVVVTNQALLPVGDAYTAQFRKFNSEVTFPQLFNAPILPVSSYAGDAQIAADSEGNIYTVGVIPTPDNPNPQQLSLVKYNSQNTRVLSFLSSELPNFPIPYVGSVQNIYVVGSFVYIAANSYGFPSTPFILRVDKDTGAYRILDQ
jgi:hypothetical protein